MQDRAVSEMDTFNKFNFKKYFVDERSGCTSQHLTVGKVFGIVAGYVLLAAVISFSLLLFDKEAGAASLDTASTQTFTKVSTTTWAHTISGSDRLLIVGVSYYSGGGRTVSNVTYGGMGLLRSGLQRQDNITAELWYLVAPPIGTANITITFNANSWGTAGATSWTGVDQSAPLGSSAAAAGNNTTPSLTLATTTNEMIHDVIAWEREGINATAIVGANQLGHWNGAPAVAGGGGSSEIGAPGVTMDWTLSQATDWALVAVSMRPSVVVPDTTSPVISNVNAIPSTRVATVTWTTDEGSDSQVEYGLDTNYGNSTLLYPSLVTSHSVTVPGLSPSTLYHYRVHSRDASGNLATSNDFTFTTLAQNVQPNILLFITDNQEARSMDEVMTKVQQHLIQQGTKFTNALVSHPLCCPSRASIFTGQYTHNHTVFSNGPPSGGISKLNQAQTIAVWLQNAGYYTGLIGKYLNDYGATDTNPGDGLPACREVPPGWSEWYGLVDDTNPSATNYALNENGNIVIYGSRSLPSGCQADSVVNTVYETDLFSQKTVDFINRRAQAGDGSPFFFYVAFDVPHVNTPAPRHAGVFSNRPFPQSPNFNEADVSDKPQFVRNTALLNAPKISSLTSLYRQRLESLLAVDEAVDAAVNALTANGQLQNTVIIFMSDQGQLLGEHRLRGILFGYEESINIPFVMRGPNIPANVMNANLIANIDIAPTLLELAQGSAGMTIDGRSFVSILNNPSAQWRNNFLLDARGVSRRGENYKGVRTPQYMYNEYPNGDKELYDLSIDPDQLTSRHNDPVYTPIIQTLQQNLNILKTCSGSSCWQ